MRVAQLVEHRTSPHGVDEMDEDIWDYDWNDPWQDEWEDVDFKGWQREPTAESDENNGDKS